MTYSLMSVCQPVHNVVMYFLSPCIFQADKPELHQLKCLRCRGRTLKIIETVAEQLEQLEEMTLALQLEDHFTNTFKGDPVPACCEMMQQWLDGEGRKPVTWSTLIKSLIEAGFLHLAENLQEILRN